MFRSVCRALGVLACSAAVFCGPARAGNGGYEPTRGPYVEALPAGAHTFFAEFRGRNDAEGFGHAYVVLGATDGSGRRRNTLIFGFMPKTVDDQRLSQIAAPVDGIVGVSRSDFSVLPDVAFRVPLRRNDYARILHDVRVYQAEWTIYSLIGRNCNDLLGRVAESLGLQAPLIGLQGPTSYVAALKAINSPRASMAGE